MRITCVIWATTVFLNINLGKQRQWENMKMEWNTMDNLNFFFFSYGKFLKILWAYTASRKKKIINIS